MGYNEREQKTISHLQEELVWSFKNASNIVSYYDRHIAPKKQPEISRAQEQLGTVVNVTKQALELDNASRWSLLYPCSGSDMSTALRYEPDTLITFDIRDLFAGSSSIDYGFGLGYLDTRMCANMTFTDQRVSTLTWAIDMHLSGVDEKGIKVIDTFFLPAAGRSQYKVAQLEYRLPSNKVVTHYNIAGIYIGEVDAGSMDELNASNNAFGFITSVCGPQRVMLHKAAQHLSPLWLASNIPVGRIITDRAHEYERTLPQINKSVLRDGFKGMEHPFQFGYATNPTLIGVMDASSIPSSL